MTNQQPTLKPEAWMRKQKRKSFWIATATIVGVVVALVFGFVAMSKSSKEFQPKLVTKAKLHSSNTGSCVFGNATAVVCRITSEEDCKEKRGFWSRQGTCDIRQRVSK